MKIRYNFIFIPILIVIIIAVWYTTLREEQEQSAKRLADRALVDTGKLDVIEIIRPDKSIRIERQSESGDAELSSDNWMIVSPFESGCDPDAFGQLKESILSAQSERDIEDVTEEQLEEYGLREPELRLRLASNSGTVMMDLAVGHRNPSETAYYAAFGDSPDRVFLVPVYDIHPLDIDPGELRDRRGLAFNRNSVESIQLSSQEAEISIQKRDEEWYVTSPREFMASAQRMEQLFHDLAELKWEEYVPADSDAPELKTNKVKVSLRMQGGKTEHLILHGEDYSKGIYATSSTQPTPFIIEAYILDRLAVEPDVFFHMMIFDMPSSKIHRVLVREPDAENLEIRRDIDNAAGWVILRPDDITKDDPTLFESFLKTLLALEPKSTVDQPENPSDYGFEPVYNMKFEVYEKNRDNPHSILYIGIQNEDGDYFGTQDGETYFTINRKLLDDLISKIDLLRYP